MMALAVSGLEGVLPCAAGRNPGPTVSEEDLRLFGPRNVVENPKP